MTRIGRAALLLLSGLTTAAAARFETRFFHDVDGETAEFRQIAFVSARRGLAIGVLHGGRSPRPFALATNDAGETWTPARLPAIPMSLFCLKDSTCWLVTIDGIYVSEEGGLDWRRISKEKNLTKVYFISPQRGWAVGTRKRVLETRDGGKTWTKLAALEKVTTSETRTVFHDVVFVDDKTGIIVGRREYEDLNSVPIWMDSDPTYRRETPGFSVVLQTSDGGTTWNAATTSMFGRITEVEGNGSLGFALAVVQFDRYFDWPAEVFRIDFRTGANQRVLRMKDFAVTDVLVQKDGRAIAAGFQPMGKLAYTPVPGKVRVMQSIAPLNLWTEVSVDYRAVGLRVTLATSDDAGVWMATDQGMILKLVP